MLVEDNLKEVLINSDITTIKQLANVNKNLEICCNDSTFWENKFKHDNLPIINEKLNKFSEWIKEYELIYKCKNDCINILLINRIESQQTYNQSNMIDIFYGYQDDSSEEDSDDNSNNSTTDINESIPYYMLEKPDIKQIQIEFVSDGAYKIWYHSDKNTDCIKGLYDEVLNILIKMMYYSYQDKNIKITDNLWHKKFTFNKTIEYDDSVEDCDLVLIQRQTIYDTLKIMNLLSGF